MAAWSVGLSTLLLAAPFPCCCCTGCAVWAWMDRCCSIWSMVPSAEVNWQRDAPHLRPGMLGLHCGVVIDKSALNLFLYLKMTICTFFLFDTYNYSTTQNINHRQQMCVNFWKFLVFTLLSLSHPPVSVSRQTKKMTTLK